MSKPLKIIVHRCNLRAADQRRAMPSIFSLAGTKADAEMARAVVFIDDDGEEIFIKRVSIADVDSDFHVVERPITPISSQEEIEAYLKSLREIVLGESE